MTRPSTRAYSRYLEGVQSLTEPELINITMSQVQQIPTVPSIPDVPTPQIQPSTTSIYLPHSSLKDALEGVPTFDGSNISVHTFIQACKNAKELVSPAVISPLIRLLKNKLRGEARRMIIYEAVRQADKKTQHYMQLKKGIQTPSNTNKQNTSKEHKITPIRTSIECTFCKKLGHNAEDCFKRKRSEGFQNI
ncbi:uncharacterized protein LOC112494513 [Cephus cinctus]|uniref:Uncharacterized protein LOC112494513 n=1 Tax=Cephus cinctus TaxID=211228 RepID=A0AAJ7W285_CEPCN|nr:uncharacterized protein LOC112494513 [Cephus cinctus]